MLLHVYLCEDQCELFTSTLDSGSENTFGKWGHFWTFEGQDVALYFIWLELGLGLCYVSTVYGLGLRG